MKEFTWWLNTFISEVDEKIKKEDKGNVFEKCGRACFQGCDNTEIINDYKKNANSISELLVELNKVGIGGGNLKIKGDTISGIYEKCYCPFRNALGDSISPEFCNCTKGWAKSLFEIILGRPVEVELVQAIGRGDGVCEFIAKFN